MSVLAEAAAMSGGPCVKIGDKVRVRPSVKTPRYKWGSVTHLSVGTVTKFLKSGQDVIVDFPQQAHWTGSLAEMELVPSEHPGIAYVSSSFPLHLIRSVLLKMTQMYGNGPKARALTTVHS